MLRGRVAADVYSIGKDAKGKRQQVVRSLAEQVANPRTVAQMRGRMIMSTVMQAVSGMSFVVDHSFDGVVAGQPSISEFIRRNYALVKADAAAHPATGNKFGLVLYQEKGIKQGAYIVAAGKAADITGVTVDASAKTLTIAIPADATVADIRTALGLAKEDYFTPVAITDDNKFVSVRLHISQAVADTTAVSADNLAQVITFEGNITPTIALSGNNIVVTFPEFSACYGIIVSRKSTDGFIHNNVTLQEVANPANAADVAILTYPIGEQRFLNGGASESASVESGNTPGEGGNTENGGGGNTENGGGSEPEDGPTGGD